MTIPQTLLEIMRKHDLRLQIAGLTGHPRLLASKNGVVVVEAESLPELTAEAINLGL
jgi:hypothetical protein